MSTWIIASYSLVKNPTRPDIWEMSPWISTGEVIFHWTLTAPSRPYVRSTLKESLFVSLIGSFTNTWSVSSNSETVFFEKILHFWICIIYFTSWLKQILDWKTFNTENSQETKFCSLNWICVKNPQNREFAKVRANLFELTQILAKSTRNSRKIDSQKPFSR